MPRWTPKCDTLEWLHRKYLLTPCVLYKGKLDCSEMERAKEKYIEYKKWFI